MKRYKHIWDETVVPFAALVIWASMMTVLIVIGRLIERLPQILEALTR